MSDSKKDLEQEQKSVDSADKPEEVLVEEISLDEESSSSIELMPIEEPEPPKKKTSVSNIVRYIIMGVALCVFAFAAVQIVRIVLSYKHAQNIYEDINNQAYHTEAESDNVSPTVDPGTDEKYPGIDASARIDFDVLKGINADVRGWIDVPSLGVSYPIVQGTDNDYYLDHAFNNEFSWSGAIFLDWKNSPTIDDPHNVIYGHHMNDGSMFAALLEYDSESFYQEQAENNNNYFYIYFEGSVEVYQIFSVCDVTFDENIDCFRMVDSSFTTQDYIDAIKAVELYDTGIEANADDTITTLYTCQNGSSDPVRHMVHGKLIATIEK